MLRKFIGIDVGGTAIKFALIDNEGIILHKWQIPTDTTENGVNIVTQMVTSIREEVDLADDFSGVGVGVPGPVMNGTVTRAVNLGWSQVPLKQLLEVSLNLPVTVINDANAAALGELWASQTPGIKDLVFVTLGTGVGGGVVVDGKIVNGNHASGGEIGHIPVFSPEERTCGCGNTNCLECYASATGMVTTMNRLLTQEGQGGHSPVTGTKEIFDRLFEGDHNAKQTFERTIDHLSRALSSIVNTLDPQEIVIGGGVSAAGSVLIDAIQERLTKYAFPQIKNHINVRKANLGNDAGVLGAVYQVRQESAL